MAAIAVAALLTLTTGSIALAQQQGGQPGAQQPTAEQQQQIAQLQQQYEQISQRLQSIQNEAMQADEVQAKREEFDAALNKAIVEANPAAEPLVEQRAEVLTALLDHEDVEKPMDQRSAEFNQQVEVFQNLEQQLAPLRQQASAQPEVMEHQQEYETVLTEKMEEIDSETPNLLAAHNQIMQQFQQIMGGGR